MAQSMGGALGMPPKPPNPMVEAMQKGAPTGNWGTMGVVPGAVAAMNPWTPTKGAPSMITGGPGGIVDAMRGMEGPPPNIAQAMQGMARPRGGPEPEGGYSDPYEAAKQARLSGRPVPQPTAPAAPRVPPPAAAQLPAGPPPSIASTMTRNDPNDPEVQNYIAQTMRQAQGGRGNYGVPPPPPMAAPRPAAPPPPAAPEYSDPYEAAKQARLGRRGR